MRATRVKGCFHQDKSPFGADTQRLFTFLPVSRLLRSTIIASSVSGRGMGTVGASKRVADACECASQVYDPDTKRCGEFPSWGVVAVYVTHGCCRMTIDPSTPKMPGRSTLGFDRQDRKVLPQARSAVRCSASRVKVELNPAKNRV